MKRDRTLRTTFDRIAEQYDAARPGYPEPLIEDVIALSKLQTGGRILEIGCGPGTATLPFARRGYSMLCLELGENLAALAAEHCRPYPAVEIRNTTFEDWPLRRQAFDLVISASAFHWIPPGPGHAKVAAALNDAGSMALFWNHSLGLDPHLSEVLEQVYRERAPELGEYLPGRRSTDALVKQTVAEIDASGLFDEVAVRRYPWMGEYTAGSYIRLLGTYSPMINLEDGIRSVLFAGIREAIERCGGVVINRNSAVLYVARVKRES